MGRGVNQQTNPSHDPRTSKGPQHKTTKRPPPRKPTQKAITNTVCMPVGRGVSQQTTPATAHRQASVPHSKTIKCPPPRSPTQKPSLNTVCMPLGRGVDNGPNRETAHPKPQCKDRAPGAQTLEQDRKRTHMETTFSPNPQAQSQHQRPKEQSHNTVMAHTPCKRLRGGTSTSC